MFITRKVYGAGSAAFVGYVVSDKYGHETQLTPIEAQQLHQWLHDNAAQIHSDVNGKPIDNQSETTKTIKAVLEKLPKSYPPYTFSRSEKGYWLEIERTIIFRGATAEEAIKHTTNYVEARTTNPDLPIGVIYGNYD